MGTDRDIDVDTVLMLAVTDAGTLALTWILLRLTLLLRIRPLISESSKCWNPFNYGATANLSEAHAVMTCIIVPFALGQCHGTSQWLTPTASFVYTDPSPICV